MKWKSKKFGDIRIIKRFALFPVCINNEWRIGLKPCKLSIHL